MRYAIIEAPSGLGLEADGVDRLAGVLLDNGLADAVHAGRLSRVEPVEPSGMDSDTGVLNAQAIAAWSPRLADEVEAVMDMGDFPLILGGDCSILLGSALALRRRGRFGLLFIDGNADFFQPAANPNGEVASMDLAFATGHGPTLLANLERRGPLIRAEDVAVLGYRDHEDQVEYSSQPLPDSMCIFDLDALRETGIQKAADDAVAFVTRPELDGFLIHLDADVLNDSVMPAVDFRIKGGLTPEELTTLLRTALRSNLAAGLEVTIYNPRLDSDGQSGRLLTDILATALTTF